MGEQSTAGEPTGTEYTALGISFLTMGIGLTISLGLTVGPAFLGVGLPFMVLGIVFITRASADAANGGDE